MSGSGGPERQGCVFDKTKLYPAILLAVVTALAGCGGSGKSISTKASTVREQSAGQRGLTAPGASVVFVSPKAGSKTGATMVATVKLTNFSLDAKAAGRAAVRNHGHLHFAMDEGRYDSSRYSTAASTPLAAKLHSQGRYSPSLTPTIRYRNLPKGPHRLVVYLVNNDDTNTDISATSIFTVR
jgi:hypothetical protein